MAQVAISTSSLFPQPYNITLLFKDMKCARFARFATFCSYALQKPMPKINGGLYTIPRTKVELYTRRRLQEGKSLQ
jgi:hypothetical protein